MANELTVLEGGLPSVQVTAATMEGVVVGGDLNGLTPTQRLEYYGAVCRSLNLNPLTKPFEYIVLNDKLTLYAKRDATDQLRKANRISVEIVSRERLEGVYVVTARATTPDGRADESVGAVPLAKAEKRWDKEAYRGKGGYVPTGKLLPLEGEDLANALMKAETKAKRRVTLSICGLGMLDEIEVDSIRDAKRVDVDLATGELKAAGAPVRGTAVSHHGLTEPQIRRLFKIGREHGLTPDSIKALMKQHLSKESTRDLTRAEYDHLCDELIPEAGCELAAEAAALEAPADVVKPEFEGEEA